MSASTRFAQQFATTPDGLPPFPDPADSGRHFGVYDGDGGEQPGHMDILEYNDGFIFPDTQAERARIERALDEGAYYSLFNLDPTASPIEIRDRYRSLAITFHPDKHQHSTDFDTGGDDNDSVFARIQHAYSILSDPHKRAVYDTLGEQGLREIDQAEQHDVHEGWQMIRRLGTPDQLRDHYKNLIYSKRLASIHGMVKTKGDLTTTIDARACFLPVSFFADPTIVHHDPMSRLSRARVAGIGLKHQFETPISPSSTIVWQAQMMARNGAGGGNVVGTVRHAFGPKCWIEAGSSVLHPRVGTAKLTYAHDQDTFGTVSLVQQSIYAPPSCTLTAGKQVYPKTTGFVTLRSGFWTLGPWGRGLAASLGRHDLDVPALSIGLTSQGHTPPGQGAYTLETTTDMTGTQRHVSADYSRNVADGLKLKIGAIVGDAEGLSGFIEAEQRVTEAVVLGVGVHVGLPGGVTMKLRAWRLGQKLSIPLLLSPSPDPRITLFSLLIPTTSLLALHHLVLIPRKARRLATKRAEMQREYADWVEQRRLDAHAAVGIMRRAVEQRVERERQRMAEGGDGLVIVEAVYGLASVLESEGGGASGLNEDQVDEKVIQVTVPVQALVMNGKLHIPGSRPKHNLLGFYDPCISERKALRVQYLFRNKLHQVIIDDHATLRAPMRDHQVHDQRDGQWEL